MTYDEKIQLILIGESGVGKTSLIRRYTNNIFNSNHLETIGIEFYSREERINNKIIQIKFWDTAGQEIFHSLTKNFYRKADGIIIVYDITNKESFERVQDWIKSVYDNTETYKEIQMIIVGNKIDLEERREVSYNEGSIFAQKNGMLFFECSAKTGNNVEKIFMESTQEIYSRIKKGFYDLENENCIIKRGSDCDNITLSKENQNSNGGFCCM